MTWATPRYSKGEVNRAARAFADPKTTPSDRDQALSVINNWRASHSFPLNTFQVSLRRKVSAADDEGLVAQRLKRLTSIVAKLDDRPSMDFARMQDIGGCRGVVRDMTAVEEVVELFKTSEHKHRLHREDLYIQAPQMSGYRSHHLIYRYFSDRVTTYNNLSIEVQIRTRLQHAWATAVETVGMFTHQSLKSSKGEAQWLRFFALMSSRIAFIEKTPPVPGTPTTQRELRAEIKRLGRSLDVDNKLWAYNDTLQSIDTESSSSGAGRFYVLELDVNERGAFLTTFSFSNLAEATHSYANIEAASSATPGADVVLVSVESVSTLRRAFPNYYADTEVFRSLVHEAIGK